MKWTKLKDIKLINYSWCDIQDQNLAHHIGHEIDRSGELG